MPTYNRERFIGEAIESIIAQTYENWELIIVDDGSKDNTVNIINTYQVKDTRIKLFQFSENKGIPFARNKCLELANGEYLANLDSDDIALPQRLEKQIEFMEKNLEIGVCGAQAFYIDSRGKKLSNPFLVPLSDQEIKFNILFQIVWIHNPSAMIRKHLLQAIQYDEEYIYAQDLKLWIDLFDKTKFHNLSDFLICYRSHNVQVSTYQRQEQRKFTKKATSFLLKKTWNNVSSQEIDFHLDFTYKESKKNLRYLELLYLWLQKILIYYNPSHEILKQDFLKDKISELWLKECIKNTNLGFKVWWLYQSSTLKSYKIGYKNQLTFLVDCLLKQKSRYIS
jgi:glycosyltransferase involved in cell wall biosynthesis